MKIMKREKKVLRGFMIFGIVLVSLSIVSAGFFDNLFKLGSGDDDLKGELAETAPAKVEVTGSADPATVVFVDTPWDTDGTDDEKVSITINDEKSFNVDFQAYHEFGYPGQLPGAPYSGGEDVTDYVTGNVSYDDVTNFMDLQNCWFSNVIDGNTLNYTCDFTLNYYHEPDVDWIESIQIKSELESWSEVNNSQTFQINKQCAYLITPLSINWSTLTKGNLDTLADFEIQVSNQGNLDIESSGTECYLRISANQLLGEERASETISASNFTSGDEILGQGACANSKFSEGSFATLNLHVEHEGSTLGVPESENLIFCLNEIAILASPQIYKSDISWEMNTLTSI